MNCDCSTVEIALKFESGLADKLFVLRLAILCRILAEIGEQANGLEVDVENRVGVGKKADGIRSSTLSEEDGETDSSENNEDSEGYRKSTTAMSHGSFLMIRKTPAGRQLPVASKTRSIHHRDTENT